ncbi:unnamed protein product, partial [Iphiclides podalirius]
MPRGSTPTSYRELYQGPAPSPRVANRRRAIAAPSRHWFDTLLIAPPFSIRGLINHNYPLISMLRPTGFAPATMQFGLCT